MSKEKTPPEAETTAAAEAPAEAEAAPAPPHRDLAERVAELEARVDELESHTQAPRKKGRK